MNQRWLLSIILCSGLSLYAIKQQQDLTLRPFIKIQKSVRITTFQHHAQKLESSERKYLGIWESILTGKSRLFSADDKVPYRKLGLLHFFTPSGFHLTAILGPVNKIIRYQSAQMGLLVVLGLFIFSLPAMWALKRMALIKFQQRLFGSKPGFLLALLLDSWFGSLQHSPLSFSYSFLFLGIIYSGLRGVGLVIWFFIAQVLINLFQAGQISPLLLFFSPLLNLVFGLMLPVIFLMTSNLWQWQLDLGINLIRGLDVLVAIAAKVVDACPVWEANLGLASMIALVLWGRWRWLPLPLLLLSHSLNHDPQKIPTAGTYEFRPQQQLVEVKHDRIYYKDGICRVVLVKGSWWEKCSPRRRALNKIN
jgi:hypothetical protein